MVTVSLGTPMLLGGNAEPAYQIIMSALALEIAPTMNKRSASLVQKFMTDSLRIPENRGVIRFEALDEHNLATNGKTTLQEIEEMEIGDSGDNGILRTISENRPKKGRKSPLLILTERGKTPVPRSNIDTPSKPVSRGTIESRTTESNDMGRKMMKHRKSFMAFFGK